LEVSFIFQFGLPDAMDGYGAADSPSAGLGDVNQPLDPCLATIVPDANIVG
jgi:hypothetical protein